MNYSRLLLILLIYLNFWFYHFRSEKLDSVTGKIALPQNHQWIAQLRCQMLLHHTQCKLNNILKKDLAIFWFRIFLTIATLNHNVTKRMYLAFKFMYRKKKAFEICILNWNCKLWKLIWIWDRIRIKSEFYLLFDYSIASETWKWFTLEPKNFWIRICFFLERAV